MSGAVRYRVREFVVRRRMKTAGAKSTCALCPLQWGRCQRMTGFMEPNLPQTKHQLIGSESWR